MLLTAGCYVAVIGLLTVIPYKGKPLIYVTNNYMVWKGGDTWQKFQEFDRTAKHDIIFMGSSRCYRFYNPVLFEKEGYQTFNLGTSAQSLENTSILLKSYVSKQNCDHIVLDCSVEGFRKKGEGFESTADLITNLNDTKIARKIASREFDVRFFNLYVMRLMLRNAEPFYLEDEYVSRGFCTNSRVLNLKSCEEATKPHSPIHEVSWDPEKFAVLDDLLLWCSNQGISVTMVAGPYTNSTPSSWIEELNTKVSKLCHRYGFELWDFSKMPEIDNCKHFYDQSHINEEGVKVFNRALIDRLNDEAKGAIGQSMPASKNPN